jgi:hypothetical protein
MKVFDIDYLYLDNGRVALIEEKTKNIDGKEFQRKNYIYLDHGTFTQNLNLKKASKLGIESGIFLRCIKNKQPIQGFLATLCQEADNILFEETKFYPIESCEYLPKSNKTRIKVDDFIIRMRHLGFEKYSKNTSGSEHAP